MLIVQKNEKENPKRRMIIDFRKLKKHTITDIYIIFDVNVTLQNLGKAKCFTTLNLEPGFRQIQIKNGRDKTALCAHGGRYKFVRMSFGLKNALSIFLRSADYILRDFKREFVYVSIDDVLIYSPSPEEHM